MMDLVWVRMGYLWDGRVREENIVDEVVDGFRTEVKMAGLSMNDS